MSTAPETGPLDPRVCTDPDCTIKRRPGFPMHGPHDFRAATPATPATVSPAARHTEPTVVMTGCVDMDRYAAASNDGFDLAIEQVIEDLHDYCDPDDDADTAAILRDYASHLTTWLHNPSERPAMPTETHPAKHEVVSVVCGGLDWFGHCSCGFRNMARTRAACASELDQHTANAAAEAQR